MIQLSQKQVRQTILSSQGFFNNDKHSAKKQTEELIRTLGYVQLDTIAVVERAHHHTLWSRIPEYKSSMLDDLQIKDKKVFEYWSHAAAILPMSDFRYSLPRKKMYADGKLHWFRDQDKKMKKYVLDCIKNEGAKMSKDFEHISKNQGWYEWKPAKIALEQLFMEGKLMVSKRHHFHKVYDLTERVIPESVDISFPQADEHAMHLVMKFLNAHGIVNSKEIYYLQNHLKLPVEKAFQQCIEEGIISEVNWKEKEKEKKKGEEHYFALENAINKFSKASDIVQLRILSPFDNLIIQRQRVKKLFDFDYQIECYVPESKRKFGYFCLPILYKNNLVGRLDCKADRKLGTLLVHRIFIENKEEIDAAFTPIFWNELNLFATFNSCDKIEFSKLARKDLKV